MHEFALYADDDVVASIGRRFLDRSLPKTEWTHAGHVAATLFLLYRRPELDLSRALPPLIRAYNEATGVRNGPTTGYHETITQASIRAARAFVASDPARSLHACCNDLLGSPLGKPEWLLAYWTRARLFSVAARASWCDPDVRPLPF